MAERTQSESKGGKPSEKAKRKGTLDKVWGPLTLLLIVVAIGVGYFAITWLFDAQSELESVE